MLHRTTGGEPLERLNLRAVGHLRRALERTIRYPYDSSGSSPVGSSAG